MDPIRKMRLMRIKQTLELYMKVLHEDYGWSKEVEELGQVIQDLDHRLNE